MSDTGPSGDLCRTCHGPITWGEIKRHSEPVIARTEEAGAIPRTRWEDVQAGKCERGHRTQRVVRNSDTG